MDLICILSCTCTMINFRVLVMSCQSQVVKGEVFAQDRGTKCIILREPTEGAAKCNLRVLKEDFIKVS